MPRSGDGVQHDLGSLGAEISEAIDINDARQIPTLACYLEDCLYVRLDSAWR